MVASRRTCDTPRTPREQATKENMQKAHSQRKQESITQMINRLQRGHSYHARTSTGQSVSGEYLGTETSYGEPAILLRHLSGTTAIHTTRLVAIIEAG